MTTRGRPKGSKNKFPKGSRTRNPIYIFLRVLPKEEQKKAVNLSELTGISLEKICGDAMAEGLACLEKDVYAELVRFNERRGRVISEKDLVQGMPRAAAEVFTKEDDVGTDPVQGSEEDSGQCVTDSTGLSIDQSTPDS